MNVKTLGLGLGTILVLVLAALGLTRLEKSDVFRGTSYGEPYPPAPAIDLIQANGEPFRLAEQRGRIVLVFFGYTHCPDVCPTTLAQLKLMMDELGDKADVVQVIFITVDPERDTPQEIQQYAGRFNSTFIGLSGSLEQLQKIWDEYGIYRSINQTGTASLYIVDHTARIALVDVNGNLRLSYGFQTPYEDIIHDIELLMN